MSHAQQLREQQLDEYFDGARGFSVVSLEMSEETTLLANGSLSGNDLLLGLSQSHPYRDPVHGRLL